MPEKRRKIKGKVIEEKTFNKEAVNIFMASVNLYRFN